MSAVKAPPDPTKVMIKQILQWLNPLNLFWIVDPCSQTVLESDATCFTQLSRRERDAAIVWYLWQALQACASYSSDIDVLLADGACFKNEPEEMLHAMEVVLAGEAANDAGASLDITAEEAAAGIKCLKDADAQTIRALKVVLLCKFNACINPIS